ncbi:MAG: M20/M25/M40 family metallo-hydrolase [bacterium]|nr:M20/M25/M40 family metallo-hydrolase [bacterium]
MQIESQGVAGDRCNVLGTLPGDLDYTVVLEAHLDTVPMPSLIAPSGVASGRLWGRGSCDTKASMAAMLVAIETISASRASRPTVIFAGVVDEEHAMAGSRALIDRLAGVDAIVVGEPTSLRIVRAHNGCLRFEIEVLGRAAHSSRATIGRNAILDASRVVIALQDLLGRRLENQPHALTGVGLITPTIVAGGVAPNIVPDSCRLQFDRRVLPGETTASVLDEIDFILEALRAEFGIDSRRSDPWLDLPAVEVAEEHDLVQSALAACHLQLDPCASAIGVPYGTDASIFAGVAGIPSIVVGPGSIDQAHAQEEWVNLAEIRHAVDLYVAMVGEFAKRGKG